MIELLVAVAIIAILMALAFPMFSNARKRAKQTACSNNLKQLGIAIACYVQDWDEKLPWAWDDNEVIGYGKRPSLHDVLAPYVRAEEVWRCPSDTGETFLQDPMTYHSRTSPFFAYDNLSSYAWTGKGWLIQTQLAARPVSAIKSASRGVQLSELRPWHGVYDPNERIFESQAKYIVLHFDGHIDMRTWEERYMDEWYGLYEPTQ